LIHACYEKWRKLAEPDLTQVTKLKKYD